MFEFPNPVNEKAARVVAGAVVAISIVAIATGWRWLLIVLAVGFALRVAAGPRYSPLGRLATRVVAPRLGPATLVPGPPKRFAQAIGLAFSVAAILLAYAFDAPTAAWIVTGALACAAFLESALGLCLGCQAFSLLMRAGVVPQSVCEECANIWARRPPEAAAPR
ncbi:MAG: transporter permease [Solirubrobacterales bacterium]|nr:transporter permease [Solirubrobacterales bacterium]